MGIKDFIKENWFKAGILITILVLGGLFYMSQLNKQQSIERQQEIQRQNDKIAEETKAESIKARQNEIALQEEKLNSCLLIADDNYQANFESYCISEGRGVNCPSIKGSNSERVLAIERNEKADCFKKYPQK